MPSEKTERFQRLVEAQPDNELARFSLGSCLIEEDAFEEAEPHLARALELKDDWVVAYILRARCLIRMRRYAEARPLLVTTDQALIEEVNRELTAQLEALSTREVAAESLRRHGAAVLCASLEEAIEVCDRLAPEHLELMLTDAQGVAAQLKHYGGLFIGAQSAEVFGDYGLGPNHVLPTGGVARRKGGLSVFDFLRVRTWMRLDPEAPLSSEELSKVSALARLEGLEGHARSAERRA